MSNHNNPEEFLKFYKTFIDDFTIHTASNPENLTRNVIEVVQEDLVLSKLDDGTKNNVVATIMSSFLTAVNVSKGLAEDVYVAFTKVDVIEKDIQLPKK